MEPKHQELLGQCRASLAQAMSEVDRVVELLEAAGALGPHDLRQLRQAGAPGGQGGGGGGEEEGGGGGGESAGAAAARVRKAELLLQLLLAKERDHFQDLRVALEKTQPHLLAILYLNHGGAQPGDAAGSTYSVLSIMPSDSESSSSLSSTALNFQHKDMAECTCHL